MVTIDLTLVFYGVISILLTFLSWVLRTWYLGVEAHMKSAAERLERIERAIIRLGESTSPRNG